ncbi:MAG TPA: DUF2283 domain-containing protein [Nitrospirae bacterium]|nr:DUF2283 domain-containing protein [Nitrospirota bacterium]
MLPNLLCCLRKFILDRCDYLWEIGGVDWRVSDDIVLDICKGDGIVGIEILDASTHVNLKKLLPIQYEGIKSAV